MSCVDPFFLSNFFTSPRERTEKVPLFRLSPLDAFVALIRIDTIANRQSTFKLVMALMVSALKSGVLFLWM